MKAFVETTAVLITQILAKVAHLYYFSGLLGLLLGALFLLFNARPQSYRILPVESSNAQSAVGAFPENQTS